MLPEDVSAAPLYSTEQEEEEAVLCEQNDVFSTTAAGGRISEGF